MLSEQDYDPPRAHKALAFSTLAFTVCFAVWTIFSVIGVKIKQDLGLSDTQFGILVATPVLTGSISRIFLGMWTERYGGRLVFTILMLATSVAVFLLSSVTTYGLFLVAALGIGLAGGSFIVGIAYTSEWYDKTHQGTALGVFGAGNVGAAVTNFGAPFLVVALGWEMTAQVYAAILAGMAVVYWSVTENDPRIQRRQAEGIQPTPVKKQLEPLRNLQVWRFSLYYFFVFGAFVALASWLPNYYVNVYELSLEKAGMLAALYALPASVFRALGGWMADRVGARTVMYWTYGVSLLVLFVLSYPQTRYIIEGIDGPIEFAFGIPLALFVALTIALGFVMSLGKAAVYKHIPVYYPDHVGSVGGLVGMIGGLGGFFLPIMFGALNDLLGVWTSCFMLLFLLVLVSLLWMHGAIVRMERRRHPERAEQQNARDLPEIQPDYGQEGQAATN